MTLNCSGAPPSLPDKIVGKSRQFQALDNFFQVFAVKRGETVLLLSDPLLDPGVVQALQGVCRSRGAELNVFMAAHTRLPAVPEEVKPLLRKAQFVVSTWFCSIEDPFNVALRKEGQRWVKITYFRDLDLLNTPQARFPLELLGEIIRATEKRFPVKRDFVLHFADPRGTDLRIPYSAAMRDSMFSSSRWRGKMIADEPGCYVHYLPTHGPNLWDSTAMKLSSSKELAINGVLYPQIAIGFERPFSEKIAVVFKDCVVTEVFGESPEAGVLREMLVGGKLIEGGGCGFNPKASRREIYPAGSNAAGALHFGIELCRPSQWILRYLPDWEEPPTHQDLVLFDATVNAGSTPIIENGFLCALRDPEVLEMAKYFGDPASLLESPVDSVCSDLECRSSAPFL